MKSTVTPAEILETIKSLPAVETTYTGMEPQDRLKALLSARPDTAFVTRLIIYSVNNPPETQSLMDGGLPVHEACSALDGEMQLVEMDTDTTVPEDNARAVAFGLMSAQANTGLIITACIGPQETVTGNFFQETSPNVAAILGTMISGAIAGIPVIAEGPGAVVAADALAGLRPDMMPYVFVCDASEDTSDGAGYAAAMLAAWGLGQALEENAA